MEKIRYGGTIYELVPGGFDTFTEGKLTLKHLKEGRSLEEIKETAKTVTTTDSIDLLDTEGKLIRSMEGYVYAGEIQEIENYLIEEKQVPAETEEGQKSEIKAKKIWADIAMVVFRLPDVREELAEVKAVQDEILVAMLGGI